MADLLAIGAGIRAVDPDSAARAREGLPDVSGRLLELAEWLAATSGRWPVDLARPRLVHIGALPAGAVRLAADAAVGTRPLDPGDADGAADRGVGAADDEIDAGAEVLLLATPDAGAAPAVAVSLLTGAEPVALLPRGADATDTPTWVASVVAIRDLRRTVRAARSRPAALVDELGSAPLAAATGFVLQCAARRTPLVIDGPAAAAAALLAFEIRPRAAQWLRLADAGTDPVSTRVMTHLGQRAVLDLGALPGTGVLALLSLSILQAATKLHTVEAVDG